MRKKRGIILKNCMKSFKHLLIRLLITTLLGSPLW